MITKHQVFLEQLYPSAISDKGLDPQTREPELVGSEMDDRRFEIVRDRKGLIEFTETEGGIIGFENAITKALVDLDKIKADYELILVRPDGIAIFPFAVVYCAESYMDYVDNMADYWDEDIDRGDSGIDWIKLKEACVRYMKAKTKAPVIIRK